MTTTLEKRPSQRLNMLSPRWAPFNRFFRNEDEKEKSNFSRKEYNYSYFSRTITLPEYVESEDIAAKYTDGVLSLTIPKKPESKSNTNQKIKIQ
ncbi:MAG: Hsp20/alpha crystallin family protein [Bacteroidia bacterium]